MSTTTDNKGAEIMTTTQAKKNAAERLHRIGVMFTRITAKTVSFEDLGRSSKVFVTVKGAIPKDGDWAPVQALEDEKGKGYILELR